jgi:hypothetical protein
VAGYEIDATVVNLGGINLCRTSSVDEVFGIGAGRRPLRPLKGDSRPEMRDGEHFTARFSGR